MEFNVKSKELAVKLKIAAKVINTKSPLPILGCFMFECQNGILLVTASDGEQWLSQKQVIENGGQDSFKFCVPAMNLLRAIDNLNDVIVKFIIDESANTFTCDYGNGKFSMAYESANEYPNAITSSDGAYGIIVDGKKILKAIELTGFATAVDELRPIMNGIHFDFLQDGMVSATTDGLKLARYKDKTIVIDNNENTPNFTLPKKPANVLMTILNAFDGDIKLLFNDKMISVSNKEFKLTARLLESKYPNYNSVIPQNNPITITADKIALLQALKRVLPMANDSSCLVELDFQNGKVIVSAKDIDFSKSASETVVCDCDAEIKIGFKGSTLIDLLKNISDENIVIELSEPNRAGVFYSAFEYTRDEYISLCMPMLIQ